MEHLKPQLPMLNKTSQENEKMINTLVRQTKVPKSISTSKIQNVIYDFRLHAIPHRCWDQNCYER